MHILLSHPPPKRGEKIRQIAGTKKEGREERKKRITRGGKKRGKRRRRERIKGGEGRRKGKRKRSLIAYTLTLTKKYIECYIFGIVIQFLIQKYKKHSSMFIMLEMALKVCHMERLEVPEMLKSKFQKG